MPWNEFIARVLAATGIVLAAAALFAISWFAVDILLLLFGSMLFAILVRAISEGLTKTTPLGPKASVAFVLLSIGAAISFAAWLLAPDALEQLRRLSGRIPELKQKLDQSGFGAFILHFPGMSDVLSGSGNLMTRLSSTMSATAVPPLYIGLAAIVGVFLSIQPGVYKQGLMSLFPLSKRGRAAEVFDASLGTLRTWILAKAIGMAFVGGFVGFGLWFLDVPLAFSLGVIAGLLDFIPNIGAIISFIPAALLAMLKDPATVVWVALVYLAAHSIDNYVLLPWLQLRLVRVPPGLALSAQLLLGALVGPLGLIFAVPILALLMVLTRMLYVDSLGGAQPKEGLG